MDTLRKISIPPQWQGVILSFGSAACLSMTFVASKEAMRDLHPLAFAPVWFLIASLWGLAYYILFEPHKVPLASLKPHLRPLFLLGLSSSISNFFLFTAIKMGDPTIIAFFSRATTVFAVLMGVVILKERLSGGQWLGAGIVIVGAGVMTYKGGALIWTVLAITLVANFFNALTSFIAKRNVANVPPIVLGIARTVGLTGFLGLAGLASGVLTAPSLRALGWMVLGSFFGPFLSFLLFFHALRTIDLGQAAIIRATQPLFVAVYSFILFGTLIGITQFSGGLIILLGIVLILQARTIARSARRRWPMGDEPRVFKKLRQAHPVNPDESIAED